MSQRSATPATDSFNEICTVRIELLETEPLIWRQVEVPTSITLKGLHDIIQIAMGWCDMHLWEFTVDRRRYGLPLDEDWGTEPRAVAGKVKLRSVLKPKKTAIDYVYDFGDDWQHRLTVTDVRQADPGVRYPRYVAGERNAPREDCGGVPGFYDKLDILADPSHPDHDDIKEWMGDYDPDQFDDLPIKLAIGRLARRRSAGRVRSSNAAT